MEKTLVTKLQGVVSNNALKKIGEMRISIKRVDSPNLGSQSLAFTSTSMMDLNIIGDGYFTDETLSVNKGKTLRINNDDRKVFFSNGDFEIAFMDKYKVASFSYYYSNQQPDTIYNANKYLNIDDLKYSNLSVLNMPNTNTSGDLGSLEHSTNMSILSLYNTNVYGSIDSLKNLTMLTSVEIFNKKEVISGNIESFKEMMNLKKISLKNASLSGDLSTIPSNCVFASFDDNKKTSFTWKNRPSSSKIVALVGNAIITNIDKMLQDQAQGIVGFSESDSTLYKTISVVGTRTSASDAAIQTLQSKGYTVSILPA